MRHKSLRKKFETLLWGSDLKLFMSISNKTPEIMDEGFGPMLGYMDHSAWFYVSQSLGKRIMRSKSLDCDLYHTLRTVGLNAESAFMASLIT